MTVPAPASTRTEFRAGAVAAAPLLLGVVPFGLVAGAAPVAAGLDLVHAIGLSSLVFAGASQLAIAEVLGGSDPSVAVAVVTALVINLRMVLYSASMAPLLAHERLRSRLLVAYLLVDQAYALAVTRWTGADDRRLRRSFFLGVASVLWLPWQVATIVGAVAGTQVPEEVPLTFAVPLVFLVLLVPVVASRPALVAAVVGGCSAVATAELGAARLSVVVGGAAGIAAGALAEAAIARRGHAT